MGKNNIKIYVLGAVFIIALAVFFFFSGLFQQGALGESSIDLSKQYPTIDSRLVRPVYSSLDCEYTGELVKSSSTAFVPADGKTWWVYHWVACPADVGSQGCTVDLTVPSCKKGGLLCAYAQPFSVMRKDNSAWVRYTGSSIRLSAGDNVKIDLACSDDINNFNSIFDCNTDFVSPVYYSLSYSQRKLRVSDPQGCAPSGWLAGSNDCTLVSTELSKLKSMQPSDEPLSLSAGKLPFGETQSFVSCWTEDTVVGNFNPLGKYNGKNVFCSPYNGLFEAKSLGTVGGKSYFIQGSKLLSRTSTNEFCCSTDECGGTAAVCEDYLCKEKPVKCTFGMCNQWQDGVVVYRDKEIELNGKYYLETQTCNFPCMDVVRDLVKCTKSYCDRMSTVERKLYCDYDRGCIDINVLSPCPAGSCCVEGGNWKPQECVNPYVCCKSSTSLDKFIGVCKAECEVVPPCTKNSDCNTGQVCANGDCVSIECKDKLGGLILGSTTTSESCGLWCKWGWSEPTVKNSCSYDYTLLFILAFVLIALGVIVYFVSKKKKNSRRRRRR